MSYDYFHKILNYISNAHLKTVRDLTKSGNKPVYNYCHGQTKSTTIRSKLKEAYDRVMGTVVTKQPDQSPNRNMLKCNRQQLLNRQPSSSSLCLKLHQLLFHRKSCGLVKRKREYQRQ